MSDVFREVNEDLRREQLKQLWRRFGKYIIGGAVLIVVIVAGYQILQSVQQSKERDSGDRYQAAFDLYRNGDLDGATTGFLALTEDGYGGYPTLAVMALANIRAEQGDIAGAVQTFDQVAADNSVNEGLRNSAKIRAAFLLIDTASFTDIENRLSEFMDSGNPYRVLALEALSISAIAAGNYQQAGQYVVQMVQDPFANSTTNARAQTLYAYINAHMPATPAGGEAAASGAATAPGGAAPAGFTPEGAGAAAQAPAGFAAGSNPLAAPTTNTTPVTVPTTPLPGTNPLVPLVPAN